MERETVFGVKKKKKHFQKKGGDDTGENQPRFLPQGTGSPGKKKKKGRNQLARGRQGDPWQGVEKRRLGALGEERKCKKR